MRLCDRRKLRNFNHENGYMNLKINTCIAFLAFTIFAAPHAFGQDDPMAGVFQLRFGVEDLTTQQQTDLAPSLAASKSFWESIIVGYQPGVTLDGIEVDVSVADIDGPSGTLAFAGTSGFLENQGGFTFVTNNAGTTSTGVMTIDTADFSSNLIVDVINHEVGHALGFGTLFDSNNLTSGAGIYSGTNGLLAYQAEVDLDATFIPLQNDPPFVNGHFDENIPLTDVLGRDFSAELFTPFIENGTNAENPELNFFSQTSAGVFQDLGYIAFAPVAIPEPSSIVLLALSGLTFCRRRR